MNELMPNPSADDKLWSMGEPFLRIAHVATPQGFWLDGERYDWRDATEAQLERVDDEIELTNREPF